MTTVYNRANEEAVRLFLERKIGFTDIPKLIEKEMEIHRDEVVVAPTLSEILEVDKKVKKDIMSQI